MQLDEQTDASFSRHSYITVNTDVPLYSMSPSVTMARVEMSQTLSDKQMLYTTTTQFKTRLETLRLVSVYIYIYN